MIGMQLGIGIGITMPRGGGGVPPVIFDPDAEALFGRMTVQPDEVRKGVINEAVLGFKVGGLWATAAAIYVLAAHDAQAARLNWKGAAFDLAAVNSPGFTVDRGYTGDAATSYLDSGYNASSEPTMLQNSNHMAVMIGTDVGAANKGDIGASRILINSRSAANTMVVRNSSGTNDTVAVTGDTAIGYSGVSRNNATDFSAFRDAAAETIKTRVSTPFATQSTVFLLGVNGEGPMVLASDRRVQAAHFGLSITDGERLAAFATLTDYMTAVGAV